MDKSFRWKLVILVVVLAASIWVTLPTFRLYGMPEAARNADTKEANDLRAKAVKLGLDLQGGMHLVLELDTSNLRREDVPRALDRAIQILRNRIDRFNVREPLIQKQGDDRILMQLPGVADKTRALDLVGQTAQLEFKIVKEQAASRQVLESLDRALARKRGVRGRQHRAPARSSTCCTATRSSSSAERWSRWRRPPRSRSCSPR